MHAAHQPPPTTPSHFISIEQVEKRYGDIRALGPVTSSLERKNTLCVVGPSGCGKSTLIRLLAGLEKPSAGRLVIDGSPVTEATGAGVVFQRDLLLDWRTIIENVLLPARLAGQNIAIAKTRAYDLLTQLGVADFAERRPWELSGGMRQRVAIARAFLCRPQLLLMDEPFSALDALTRDQMAVILQEVQHREGATTVLITHSIPEAVFLADRVLVMSGRPGRVLDDIVVDFPRPRKLSLREEPAFTEIARRIRLHFERTGVLVG